MALPFVLLAGSIIGATLGATALAAEKTASNDEVKKEILEDSSSENEKIAFVKGLIRLAKVDQRIALEERKFLDEIVVKIGLDSKYIPEFKEILESNDHLDSIKISFENRKKSILFLREAIQLCKVDGEYHEKEKAEIDKIAEEMGVSANAVKEIENWADRGIQWQKEGFELLNLE